MIRFDVIIHSNLKKNSLRKICVSCQSDRNRKSLMHWQWRHNESNGVSNHQPHDCFLNCLFRRRSKKTSKLRVTDLCAGNSPVTGEFPAQRASNEENVSIWWRHNAACFTCARNIVFQHKINFCVHVERIMCFPCVWLCFICISFKVTNINIVFVCVYFGFTLFPSTWWTQSCFKSAHRERENFLNTH